MSEDIFSLWSSTLHMTVFTIVQEGLSFKDNIKNCYREHLLENDIMESIDESNIDLHMLYLDLFFYNQNLNSYTFLTTGEKDSVGSLNNEKHEPSTVASFFLQATGPINIGWVLSKKHK